MGKSKTELYIATTKLNIREKPSKGSEIAADSPVGEGAEITVYTGTETEADGYEWIQVNFKGKKRWAAKEYLLPAIIDEEVNSQCS